jgi:hypothetical protein
MKQTWSIMRLKGVAMGADRARKDKSSASLHPPQTTVILVH